MSVISVVPVPVAQPVYMNMSDLDRMRQQKLEQQQSQEEDGLDLKTPTQEDLDNLPSSSDGSSSGYGSQNLVMEQQQQGYNDGKGLKLLLPNGFHQLCIIFVSCYFSFPRQLFAIFC